MSTDKLNARFLLQLASCVMLMCSAFMAYAASVTNARVWPAPDHTRLVFEVTAGVQHKL